MTATISAAVLGLTNAILQVVISFGVNVSDTQNAAITALVNALLVFSALVWELRSKRSPVPPTPVPPPAPGV